MIEAQEATSSKSTESRANGSLLGTTLSLATSLILLAGSNFKPSDASRGLVIEEDQPWESPELSQDQSGYLEPRLSWLDRDEEREDTTLLHLFTRPGTGIQQQAIISRSTKTNHLLHSGFNPEYETLLMFHGYRGGSKQREKWAMSMKDLALGQRGYINVFFVDWGHRAQMVNYIDVVESLPQVARDVDDILRMISISFPKFRPEDCQMVGHSLGAHVAGLVGKLLESRVHRITALDPAGPVLEGSRSWQKISQDDGQFVVAYHTANMLGTEMLVADADVFFNNATEQPQCEEVGLGFAEACRHKQAAIFAGAYFGHCPLVGVSCPDYARFIAGRCGFCPREQPDTPPCALALGHEWQYEIKLRAHHKKPAKWPKQPKGSTDVEWEPRGNRESGVYQVATSTEYPHCAFLYQVVVRFPEMEATEPSGYIMLLTAKGSPEVAQLRISHHFPARSQLEVFGSAEMEGGTEFVSGYFVYTHLMMIGNETPALYKAMPLKFDHAHVIMSTRFLSMMGNKLPEVWVNYMSSSEFDIRASHSGPIGNVTIGAQLKLSRTSALQGASVPIN